MLWGIDPLLDADLLYALRRMGHGDEIAVVDTNYPAASNAISTVVGRPLLMAGVSAARAVEAIFSVMPLDTFVPDPAGRMEVVGDPHAVPPVQREVQQVTRPRGRQARAARRHRALRLLRAGETRVRHPRRRRAPLLRRLHLQEGRRPAGVSAISSSAHGEAIIARSSATRRSRSSYACGGGSG